MTDWREYHEATKHTRERLWRSPHTLDWANMPDPFRHYEGAALVDLPADLRAPPVPMLDVLRGGMGSSTSSAMEQLSALFFYSAAISASKRVPATGYRYALRVNPSSGNLHPTEFHFRACGGLYHYRPSSHMLERRGAEMHRPQRMTMLLTTIYWREAWKYRDRAYRYCLLDAGHAAESVAIAARAIGLHVRVLRNFPDDTLGGSFCLADDEWPMLLVRINGLDCGDLAAAEPCFKGGRPNRLSAEIEQYPLIEEVHRVTKTRRRAREAPGERRSGAGAITIRPEVQTSATVAEVTRRRRSALDFGGGERSISFEQFSTLLHCATRGAEFIQLYAYVHRVQGLEHGVYRYWQQSRTLELVKLGDQRVVAAGLSLTQDLAGNSCVTFSMIADLERATRIHGNRGYRYVHFEAGAIGQRLYLASEAMGFNSTGIGAFFDDEVHQYLGIAASEGQVIYHFACGYAVNDPRLSA